MYFARMRSIRRIPHFERGREYLLLLVAGGGPEDAEVLSDLLGSGLAIGNEGTVVTSGVGVLADGVSRSVPIGSEGVPVVTSEVVD